MEETSLSDFLGDESSEDEVATRAAESGTEAPDEDALPDPEQADATEPGGPPVDPSDVEPAQTTAAWSPDDATCGDCGSSTDWLWRDGDALVCPDCTSW